MVVRLGNPTRDAHLNVAHHRTDQHAELQVRERFPDTSMPTGTKRLVRTLRALAHCTESVIDLLPIFVRVLLKRLLSLALWVNPAIRDPLLGFDPQRFIDLGHSRTREDIVALRHNVLRILRRCRECPGDNEVSANVANDAVNRRVQTEGLANYGIQERKSFEILIGWQAKGAVRLREMFDLLLIERLTNRAMISF